MSFDFLNPWMLAGLAGISLPIIAHLLSKKKYDVVQWGAMQFLELGRETRRRVRLEELLLLLLRIAIICLIVFAFARPWASGGFFKHLVSAQPRDVVIIIDGSFSMGWQDGVETPHQQAVDWAREFLNNLEAGDTVALIDARDQVRTVIERPTYDVEWVRDELRKLPPPSGTSNLAEACSRAVQILSQTTNFEREILVLSDRQARPWSTTDANRWLRFDDLLDQPAVRPRVWYVDVTAEGPQERLNLTVGSLKLSRELTVTDFPVRISTSVRYSGGNTPLVKRINLEVNGEVVPESALTVQLQPDGEATIEFEHRFDSVGSYLVGVSVEGDALPGDNLSLAAVDVKDALPVLLVDGDYRFDPTRSETFFAQTALTPGLGDRNWVRADAVDVKDWKADELDRYQVVILANVERLSPDVIKSLQRFVENGGGLMFALGERCDVDHYNSTLNDSHLLPVLLRKTNQAVVADLAENEDRGIRIAEESLELPWLKRFQIADASLTDARFDRWWGVDAMFKKKPEEDSLQTSEPISVARLTTGDPFLIASEYGRGRILVMTAPLDADWSTLPAKPDYVAFLHESIFYLAAAGLQRNLLPGVPFIMPVDPDFDPDSHAFYDPSGEESPVTLEGSATRPVVRFTNTMLPGAYSLEQKPRGSHPDTREMFVVDFDRGESDLTPLDDSELNFLKAEDRMTKITSHDELRDELLTDNSQAELWRWMIFLFLGFLTFEVWMTRRLVQGGHASEELLDMQRAAANPEEQVDGFEVEDFEDYAPAAKGRVVRDSREG